MRELPETWVETELGQIAYTALGKMLSAKARVGLNPRPYLRNKNVQWGRIDVDDLLEMDFDDHEWEFFRLRKGDLLVCEGGEVGRSAIWRGDDEVAFQKALHRIRPSDGVAGAYLSYLLEWMARSNLFERYVTGSTINHLPQEDLRLLPVPLPPAQEQRRIVAAIEEQFSRLDAAGSAVNAARARLRGLRESTVDVRLWRGHYGHAPIGKFADLIRGVTYKKHEARARSEPGLAPLLRATNINGTLALDQDLVYVPRSRVSEVQNLRMGDIVVATSSGSAAVVGKSAPLRRDWDGTFGAFCAVVRASSVLEPSYLALVLGSKRVRERWSELARGTNINNLRVAHILETEVPIPRLDEQRRITAELEQQLSLIDSLGVAIESAQSRSAALRRAILERAFRGELVAHDPDDEPASLLLQRIRAERAASPKPTGRRRMTA